MRNVRHLPEVRAARAMPSRSLRCAAFGSAQVADREGAKRLSWEAYRPSRLATGDGTPGNPDYQSGIRGQILPTVMCRPVEPDARRRACPVRRRLIGVISLFIYNEVIPMFDPISRAPASWEPAHEHGRRGQTLDDSNSYDVGIIKAVLGPNRTGDICQSVRSAVVAGKANAALVAKLHSKRVRGSAR